MSLETIAANVADRIRKQEYVEVVAHHDADGIAAGSILCHAMLRSGVRFRLRIRQEIAVSELSKEHATLLCDLGAGMEDLPGSTMVVDHHHPHFDGEFHANPRLAGIDGERELCAAGTAYIVARHLCDNRDLCGLAVLGMIGDGQALAGTNLEIFNEGVGNGIITPARGLRVAGRDMTERWLMAINPYLEGISGNENVVRELVGKAGGTGTLRLDQLLSLCVLRTIQHTDPGCIGEVYGDTYVLEREVIPDAHALAAVVDACGKSGHGDLGASLCMRYARDAGAAWDTARAYRLDVIAAIPAVLATQAPDGVYEVADAKLAGDVADAVACRFGAPAYVAVIAHSGESCRISARCHGDTGSDLGTVLRGLARACRGSGGGHRNRAAATIPCSGLDAFRKGWHEAVAA
jgi:hypothetical protein